jgi:hypothetical protein
MKRLKWLMAITAILLAIVMWANFLTAVTPHHPTRATQTPRATMLASLPPDQSPYWLGPQIKRLADDLGLTAKGRQIFFAAQPRVLTNEAYTKHIGADSDGAYASASGGRIFLRLMVEPCLARAAGHELLHAAWGKFSQPEKDRQAQLLEAAIRPRMADSRLQKTLQDYAKREPGQRDNELHSYILQLYPHPSIMVDQYYRAYFRDPTKMFQLDQACDRLVQDLNQSARDYNRLLKMLQACRPTGHNCSRLEQIMITTGERYARLYRKINAID